MSNQYDEIMAKPSQSAEIVRLQAKLDDWESWAKELVDVEKIPYSGNRGYDISTHISGLRLQAEQLTADKERVEGELASFHERIYDAFTCPNCRGSKVQAPPFMGESEGPVACDFCKGAGTTNFAEILDGFVSPRELESLSSRLKLAGELVEAVKKFSETRWSAYVWDEKVVPALSRIQASEQNTSP